MLDKLFRVNGVMAVVMLAGAGIAHADHPYEVITAKNAFGLKAAPVMEQKVETEPVVPQSSIILSGLASVEGKKQVFLRVTAPGEKEAKYVRLGELERDGNIEVLEIDLKNERVRIKHNGQSMVMTFATHGVKAGTLPPVAKLPPVPVTLDMKQVKP
jgi:hypothetical protein